MEVRQFNGALFVTQTKYAKDPLKINGMLHSKDAISPMNTNEKLQLEDCFGNAYSSRYKRLVGRLLYLTHTKLDIMYAVGIVSRFVQEPSMHHMGAVKKILHYISGTLDYGLYYRENDSLWLVGFTDNN